MNQEINPKLAELLDKYGGVTRTMLHEFNEHGFLSNPGSVFVTPFGEVEIRAKSNGNYNEADMDKLFKAYLEGWLQAIFENEPSLQHAYAEKVFGENPVHYNDVDDVIEKAWELFLNNYQWEGDNGQASNSRD